MIDHQNSELIQVLAVLLEERLLLGAELLLKLVEVVPADNLVYGVVDITQLMREGLRDLREVEIISVYGVGVLEYLRKHVLIACDFIGRL